MEHVYDIIPVRLSSLPVPINAVSEIEKDIFQVQQALDNMMSEYNEDVKEYKEKGGIRPRLHQTYFKLMKLKQDLIKIYESITHEVQMTAQTKTMDFFLEIFKDPLFRKEHPEIFEMLGDKLARHFQQIGSA